MHMLDFIMKEAVRSFAQATRIVLQLFWWLGVGVVVAARRIGFDLQRRSLEGEGSGAARVESKACSVCGANNERGQEFCFVCGKRL